MSPEDQYWESLSPAAAACLTWYTLNDHRFHNDDPTDFINPDEIAKHVLSLYKREGYDYRHLMTPEEAQHFDVLINQPKEDPPMDSNPKPTPQTTTTGGNSVEPKTNKAPDSIRKHVVLSPEVQQ